MVQEILNNMCEVSFEFVPGLEFITAMYRSANCDLFDETYRDHRVAQDEAILDCLRDMRARLSPFMQRELEFFFKLQHSHADQALHQLMFTPSRPVSVQALFDEIGLVDAWELIGYLIEDITDEETKAHLTKIWETEQSNRVAPDSAVWTNAGLPPTDSLARVLECVVDLTETKHRFESLVRAFYQKAYRPYEEELKRQSTIALPRYRELFGHDPNRFFREYIGLDLAVFEKTTVIHVSVLTQFGSFVAITKSTDVPHTIRLGILSDTVDGKNDESDLLEKFCKVIADKNRLEIVRLLSSRPWYGQELAKHLGLSAAAISYHMGFLHTADLISLKKVDQKGYYVLDKERLKSLFSLLQRTLAIQ